MTLVLPGFSKALRNIRKEFRKVEHAEWGSTNLWLKSVDCMQKTGVWLAFEEGAQVKNFSLGCPADDPGHTLLLSFFRKILGRDLRIIDVVRLNAWINFMGFLGLAALFFAMRLYSLLAVFVLLSKMTFFSWFTESPHSACIGAAAFATLFPLSLLAFRSHILNRRSLLVFLLLGLGCLSLAMLIRGVIGMMGVMVSCIILGWMLWERRQNLKQATILLLFAFSVFIAWQSPAWTFMIRDAFSPMKITKNSYEKSSVEGHHGLSHTLYIGLGVVPNSFGIAYTDICGWEAVKKVKPDVAYASPEHFKIIKELYWDLFQNHPREVVKIYAKKLILMLRYPMISLTLFGTILLFSLFYLRKDTLMSSILAINLLFGLLILAQGVLAAPYRPYIDPIRVFYSLMLGIAVEYLGYKLVKVFRNFLKARTLAILAHEAK